MGDLESTVAEVRARIAKHRRANLNEQDTKATLIEPVLRALGWNLEDLDEVRRDYKHRNSEKPVDYALLLMRAPKLFVEAKALDQECAEDPVRSARFVVAGILVGQQRPLLVAEEGDRAALERLVVKQDATRSQSGVRYTQR